ncbi:hypothetical protein QWT87_02350 [Chryseobacterium sp. APV1]|uniref:Uncharacterized protein n=1 Tax=Chryseobacterium urinae TaxID=3058400 RepID=A0ABT8TZR6_9FLAO|nr:hypothetical protein [Chryseobacterium sp. APV1]MDO3423712.1 hypothetical protein [Chryseobacterium sp. APV1]
MKMLTKILGIFLIVFSFALYNAAPLQRGHGHGRGHGYGHGPKKHYYHGPKRTYYRTVLYHKPPRHYYKKHYYRPARRIYYAPRPQRVYPARPVVIVNL